MNRKNTQLAHVAFSILLALSLKERHGYEIIKQVEEDSAGKIKLGPGALYTSIKQLHESGLITEVQHDNDSRRRYYKLTGDGKVRLASEMELYEASVRLARERQILTIEQRYA